MRTKIFRSMSLIVFCAIITVVMISTFFYYQNLKERVFKDEQNMMAMIRTSVEQGGVEFLKNMDNQSDYRMTYIAPDGSVRYDSIVAKDQWDDMSNHIERPEVKDALEYGRGYDIRTSSTVGEKNYYYAEKLEDGYVLRLSMGADSVLLSFGRALPQLLFATTAIMLLAFWASRILTKRIVQPMNEINFDDNPKVVYEELYPFLEKIANQRKVIEEQVRDIISSRKKMETITENMSEGLIVVDKDENVISYNKCATEIMDVEAFEKKNRNLFVFNRNEGLIKIVEQALAGKRAECTVHVGQKVYQLYASPVVIGEEVDGAVIIIVDATEKELREELRREFSANVSHELKTPLTSISGYAEIMKSGMVKEEDMYKFSGVIHGEAQRLIHLVEDIIKISRLDENQVALQKETVNLAELVRENIRHLEPIADEKDVSVTQTGRGGNVLGVKQILDEMVHNILENAIKYNVEHGNVIASVDVKEPKDSGQEVVLTVKDSGIGIPQEDIERVFERFYRVDKSHSKEIGGTGLGLSIVKHGAIYHNARIEVESELHKGTTFKLIFHGNSE